MDRTHGYPMPAGTHETEEVIQRSRFRTVVGPAEDPKAAHAFVHAVRDRFPDATHHCWAFVAGPPGESAQVGMSDDGEPSGTAGRPMLTTLLHSGIGEIVAVCVRWYGGTHLGTGGLQRAYTSGVKRTLDDLPVLERIARTRFEVNFGYPQIDAVQRLLNDIDGQILQETYEGDVRYRVEIPEIRVTRFSRELADLTSGDGTLRRLD